MRNWVLETTRNKSLRPPLRRDLDSGVGKVLEAVERLGLSNNTYVIYMSDNGSGGGGKRGGLSGGKGSVWEGGIRVPLIVRGPGVAANSWCDVPVVGYDWLSTFCALAGQPVNELPKTSKVETSLACYITKVRGPSSECVKNSCSTSRTIKAKMDLIHPSDWVTSS